MVNLAEVVWFVSGFVSGAGFRYWLERGRMKKLRRENEEALRTQDDRIRQERLKTAGLEQALETQKRESEEALKTGEERIRRARLETEKLEKENARLEEESRLTKERHQNEMARWEAETERLKLELERLKLENERARMELEREKENIEAARKMRAEGVPPVVGPEPEPGSASSWARIF